MWYESKSENIIGYSNSTNGDLDSQEPDFVGLTLHRGMSGHGFKLIVVCHNPTLLQGLQQQAILGQPSVNCLSGCIITANQQMATNILAMMMLMNIIPQSLKAQLVNFGGMPKSVEQRSLTQFRQYQAKLAASTPTMTGHETTKKRRGTWSKAKKK